VKSPLPQQAPIDRYQDERSREEELTELCAQFLYFARFEGGDLPCSDSASECWMSHETEGGLTKDEIASVKELVTFLYTSEKIEFDNKLRAGVFAF